MDECWLALGKLVDAMDVLGPRKPDATDPFLGNPFGKFAYDEYNFSAMVSNKKCQSWYMYRVKNNLLPDQVPKDGYAKVMEKHKKMYEDSMSDNEKYALFLDSVWDYQRFSYHNIFKYLRDIVFKDKGWIKNKMYLGSKTITTKDGEKTIPDKKPVRWEEERVICGSM